LRDEVCHALRHPLPHTLAAHVNITIVRIPNGAKARRSSPFHARADQPVSITPAFKNARMSFNKPLVRNPFGDLTHQFVLIDPIDKFLEVKINAPAEAFGDKLLRLGHRLMGRPSRPEPRSCVRKTSGPTASADLRHRLLDESIQHRWEAQLSHPSVRFGDFHPPYRLRFVGPIQQLFRTVGQCRFR
jgi:hypothetical protein